MIEGLVASNCRYIQIDAPGYTAYVDQVSRQRMQARGEDSDVNLQRSIGAENAVISGFQGGHIRYSHLPRNACTLDPSTGKVVAQYHRERHYNGIAEQLFGRLNHHRWLLEYDSDRAGGFEPFKYLSKDKVAVLGLITTKNSNIETGDDIRRRIEDASKYIDVSRLALSPQYGFGGVGHVTLTIAGQWRKLERMLEAAPYLGLSARGDQMRGWLVTLAAVIWVSVASARTPSFYVGKTLSRKHCAVCSAGRCHHAPARSCHVGCAYADSSPSGILWARATIENAALGASLAVPAAGGLGLSLSTMILSAAIPALALQPPLPGLLGAVE